MLSGISSIWPGERTGLRGGLWPGSYKVTAHPVGGLGGPPRERVDRSPERHCAGPIMGQARAEEARVGLSQSHSLGPPQYEEVYLKAYANSSEAPQGAGSLFPVLQ